MEGVVDDILRDILTRIGGIDLTVTEFIRVIDQKLPDHVFHRDAPELLTGSRTPCGTPMLVQLLGSDPLRLGENAARAVELGAFGIDLNFGCPAKTVNRHDGGATLLKDPARVFKVIEGVRAAVPKTHSVSAKVRLGFSDSSLHREIAQAAATGGASWLTVHARTRDDGYKPPAHWHLIHSMREAIENSIPVVANGECWSPQDVETMLSVSGSKHAMLGRGLLARPGLARELKGSPSLSWDEFKPYLSEFIKRSIESRPAPTGARFAAARLKQWLKSLMKTYPEALALFERVKTLDQVSFNTLETGEPR